MEWKVKVLKNRRCRNWPEKKVMIDFDSGKYFCLKGAANDIWDLLADGITANEIADRLLKEYEVDSKTCLDSVTEFLHVLLDKGFIAFSEA